MKRSKAATVTFKDHSFDECVRLDAGLAATRTEYARKAAKKRRQAAEWEYDSALSARLFGGALAAAGGDPHPFGEPRWPEGVLALAIEPLYAPGLLTFGRENLRFVRAQRAKERRRAGGPPKRQRPRARRRRKADSGDGKQGLLGL